MLAMDWHGLAPPYATLVVDPPWSYPRMMTPPNPQGRLAVAGLPMPYDALDLDAVKALPVGELVAQDARVYLWTTNRYLRHAWDVLEAWDLVAGGRVLVWCKPRRATMNVTTEFVLMGRRGSPPALPWHGTTWFDWPRQRVHSRKPAAFYDLVESWSPGPYAELFAREPRLGWDAWGHGYELARTDGAL